MNLKKRRRESLIMSYRVKIAIQRKPAGKPGWPNINFDYEK